MNHNCCNSKDKKKKAGKNHDSFLIGIIVVTALVLGGIIFFGARMNATAQITADPQVSMMVRENSHDWGTIGINAGKVSKSFTIENKGSTPIKLYNVKTSCMCTTAQLKTSEQTSKKFGMHEKNSSVFEVQPGETAKLIVEFDPAFHGPSGVGPIRRTVTMNTNSIKNPTLSFQLAAYVVKK